MIQIKNINKTYNKGKINEIKAIKQTSLTFPERGLVIIIGSSGSGKTTLLNVIGGLEYIDSGEMIIDEEIITKKKFRKLDYLRNQKIGYIFQQYNLLPNLTVYQNIQFVLKLLGIKSEDEIEKRIDYVLKAVGMTNFKNRKIVALSGGQQQRVGIARAIAKNPEVIIADEPTGNLDSRNTVEIMNIIKKISEEKLVVLVTHEQEIAEFYGDRIIEISDGEIINDHDINHQNALNIKHNNTIYLKDMKKGNLVKGPIDIDHYTDCEIKKEIKVALISYNDSFYLTVDGIRKEKVRLIDEDSEVKIINDHYKGLAQQEVKQNDFDFSQMGSINKSNWDRGSVYKTVDAIKYAFIKIKGYKRLQKLLFLGFVFSAMMIAVSIALIGKVYRISPIDFQTVDQNYLLTNENFDDLNYIDSIQFINPLLEPVDFNIRIKQFYQINTSLPFKAHPSSINLIKEKDIIYGRYPKMVDEVVIDKVVATELINSSLYKQTGISSYKELLNLEVINKWVGIPKSFKIVGVSDESSPTIWMDETYIYEIKINSMHLPHISTWNEENMNILDGRLPNTYGEILYPEQFRKKNNYELDDKIMIVDSNENFRIVGFYELEGHYLDQEIFLTTSDLLKDNYFKYIENTQQLLVYSKNLDQTTKDLKGRNKIATNLYEENLQQYKKDVHKAYYTLITFSVTILGVSLLQLYLIIRSSLLNRIYEIGVYRSLGATKWDIQKMFAIEIMMVTTFTSLFGYTIATLIIKEIERLTPYPFTLFYFPLHYIIGGIILIYLINVLSGLYPVYRLTRISPSQILKKYDA